MEATAPAAMPRRHRSYTVVEPQCEWSHTEDCDILIVNITGFKKDELKVLFNTCGKLKVSGDRQVNGIRCARFVKEFRIPRSCDTGRIQAKMDNEDALLYVILPKTPSPPKQLEQIEPRKAAGSPSSSGHSGSGQQDTSISVEEKKENGDEMASPEMKTTGDTNVEAALQDTNVTGDTHAKVASQYTNRTGDTNAEAASQGTADSDADAKSSKWWKKIRPLHAPGMVLILAIGVGICALYVMLT